MRLCVVGFGLIGGSVAAAARARGAATEVVAVDHHGVVERPQVRGLSDRVVRYDDTAALERELVAADLVVLAAPVSAIVEQLDRVLELALLVTDCGSTKRRVVESAARSEGCARFVPGHPLAGGSVAGAEGARADLFVGQSWILCPESASADALATVQAFIRSLGAVPVTMTASEHDRALALTSHVPQLLASALLVLSERRRARVAEGPGFASATRVAGGNPLVWGDILATNSDEIAEVLRELCADLNAIADDLARPDPHLGSALSVIEGARGLVRPAG